MKKIKILLVTFLLLIPTIKVKASTTGTVIVDDYLNIRNIVGGEVVDKLTNGTQVKVINTEVGSNSMCNAWYQVSYGTIEKTGYACGDYITLLKGYASCVENDDPLNIWIDTNKSSKITYVTCDKEMEILDKDLSSNSKCSSNWYKVKYGKSIGYACSKYVYTNKAIMQTTDYERPWTSPKKAITGGAEYIAKNYIAKGQHTSYLKKYNVNPNSSYSTYNHQYMANLAAPSSEAISSYNSYKSNNLLNLPLHFIIPTYNNMPNNTSLPGSGADTSGQTNVTDNNFENKLNAQGFDETYKKKLRALHTIHPNWTFENMKTGLDFEKAAKSEQSVSSINTGNKYYYVNSSGNYVSTEPGWYLANIETVKYYLDPRNFINETYILMFESLKYSSNYTETVVQSVINNTFMKGTSKIDNETYASIFVSAGKTKDISPVYLASLARQESGVNGSKATTGNQFTYKNITYIGLYNFFNIGAFSGEESPIKAGLVWASGGSPCVIVGNNCNKPQETTATNNTNEPNNSSQNETPTSNNNTSNNESNNQNHQEKPETPNNQTETPVAPVEKNKGSNYYINKLNVRNNTSYINGINPGTTAATLLNKVSESKNASITNTNGKGLSGNSIVGTNSTITITDTDGKTKYSYKIVIYGDVNGDGNITAGDYVNIKNYLLNKSSLNAIALKGADVNKSGTITASDYVIIKNYILKKASISQL